MCINIGLILASIFSLALQATLSKDQMLEWGWRLPFLAAGVTALIGYWMRRGLPEPQTFIKAKQEDEAAEAQEGAEHGKGSARAAATVAGAKADTNTTGDVDVVIDNRTNNKARSRGTQGRWAAGCASGFARPCLRLPARLR